MDTILGKFTLKEISEANRVLGPIFFYFYTVTMVFILINVFLSIINESFNAVRNDVEKQANDYEIVDFMVHRLKENIGKTIGHAIKPIYKEPKTKLEQDFDSIMENADNIMHFMRNVTFEDLRKTKWFSEEGCNDKKKTLLRLLMHVDWDFYENELADAIPAFEQFMSKYEHEDIEKFLQWYRRKRFIEELAYECERPRGDDDEDDDGDSSSDGSSSDGETSDDSKDDADGSDDDDAQARRVSEAAATELGAIEEEIRKVFGGVTDDAGAGRDTPEPSLPNSVEGNSIFINPIPERHDSFSDFYYWCSSQEFLEACPTSFDLSEFHEVALFMGGLTRKSSLLTRSRLWDKRVCVCLFVCLFVCLLWTIVWQLPGGCDFAPPGTA